MMIRSLNEHIAKIKPEINLEYQVNGLFKIHEFTFDIYYQLGESDPLNDALVGLAELRNNTDRAKELKKTGKASVFFGDDGARQIFYNFFTGNPSDPRITTVVASYSGLINIILPSKRNWKKAGFGWLLT